MAKFNKRRFKRKNRKQKFTKSEKAAYYTGFGVGLTGSGSTSDGLTSRAFGMMSDKERDSYINGYSKGLDNVSVKSGFRKKKKWF